MGTWNLGNNGFVDPGDVNDRKVHIIGIQPPKDPRCGMLISHD